MRSSGAAEELLKLHVHADVTLIAAEAYEALQEPQRISPAFECHLIAFVEKKQVNDTRRRLTAQQVSMTIARSQEHALNQPMGLWCTSA